MTSKMSRSVGPFSILGWLWIRSVHFPDVMKLQMKETPFCQFLELLIRYRWNCALNSFRKRLIGPPTLKEMISWFNLFDIAINCFLLSIVFHYLLLTTNRVWKPIQPHSYHVSKKSLAIRTHPRFSWSSEKPWGELWFAAMTTRIIIYDHESLLYHPSSFVLSLSFWWIFAWHDKSVKSRLSFILPLSMINDKSTSSPCSINAMMSIHVNTQLTRERMVTSQRQGDFPTSHWMRSEGVSSWKMGLSEALHPPGVICLILLEMLCNVHYI